MEKEVKPYYEDDYQSLDEMSTIDLLEMKDAALEELNEREFIIHRINQILDSRIEGERPKLAKEQSMAGNTIGGKKAAAKNLASNPNFYAEIGRKGGSATFASHGSYKGFAQDIECDCDLIDGPHFVKKCAGKKGGRISKRK